MKKSIVLTIVALVAILMSTSVFAASSIAEEIYNKGKDYGVTKEHKVRMEKYFANNEITEEQKTAVLAKADEVIAIMDKAGVKDVTKLSTTDLNKVKSIVQEAAKIIGLTVKFESKGNSFTVMKGDKVVDVYIGDSGKKLIYTGSNTLTIAIASLGFMVVAGIVAINIRKNA